MCFLEEPERRFKRSVAISRRLTEKSRAVPLKNKGSVCLSDTKNSGVGENPTMLKFGRKLLLLPKTLHLSLDPTVLFILP